VVRQTKAGEVNPGKPRSTGGVLWLRRRKSRRQQRRKRQQEAVRLLLLYLPLMECAISGVILAGGASRRFGGITKSNIVIDGERIISRIINRINDLFPEIIIVTNTPSEFREFTGFKIVVDQYLKAGPLGGIHAALKSSDQDASFIFAGDMPFLNKKIISEQIRQFRLNEYEILVPKIGRFIEPLHSIYRISVLRGLERFLAEGKNRSVRDFICEMNVGYFELPDSEDNKRAFTNINSIADIDQII